MPWRTDTIHAAGEIASNEVSLNSLIIATVIGTVVAILVSFKRGVDRSQKSGKM